ncbi:MAG: transcription antitermination factor NusB [Microbacteriaceae bacterium]|nr:transcription antitermination factor NusB [Burkholderiaceae bacterium]
MTEPLIPQDSDDSHAPADPKAGPKPDARPARKPQAKSGRRRARELALQGLYQWLVSGGAGADIEAHIREIEGFDKCDRLHFDALLHGGIAEAPALDAVLARHVDRKTTDLSPVEHAVLMIGTYELTHCLDIPYRVVINEAVELAKSFGGTDGHKYVNGVLHKMAPSLRAREVAADQARQA